jgi:hypothetical protein
MRSHRLPHIFTNFYIYKKKTIQKVVFTFFPLCNQYGKTKKKNLLIQWSVKKKKNVISPFEFDLMWRMAELLASRKYRLYTYTTL